LSLIAELQRRRVFRALIGYGVGAFAVLQIIEPIMHGLHWPDAVLTYVVAGLALGFPLVVGLAWIFDINAGGVERTPPMPGLRGARLAVVLAGLSVLAAAPGVLWFFFLRAPPKAAAQPAAIPSIAVLPFVDMSPGKDQEYLSDGIAEEILNVLAQVDGLHVAGRTSSFSFKGKNEDLRAIGQSLGVDAVLEGSVRKSGDRVRITAQMIKVADGFHLWSQSYDEQLTDVFAVQDEIARSVTSATKVKLLGERPAVPAARRATNPEAYAQFLLGRQLFDRGVPDDYRKSVEALEKAIALEPTYAPAHAQLSHALGWAANALPLTRAERLAGQKRSLAEADTAYRLAPNLAEANLAHGTLRMNILRDWEGARPELTRALSLAPGDAGVQLQLGHLFAVLGRLDEAVAITRKSTEADPLRALGWDYLGRYLAAQGKLGEARQAFARALQVAPGNIWALRELGFVDLLDGKPEATRASAETQESWFRLLGLALAEHDLGHQPQAQRALDELLALPDPPNYQAAQIYAWWGDRDHAFEQLEIARQVQDVGLRYVKFDPLLRNLRADPRYPKLLQALNLPLND
jgi:TolB-like protein/Flp pilus assembly protein TadD